MYRPVVQVRVWDNDVVAREVGSAGQDGGESCRVVASGHKLTLWRTN